MEVHSTAANSDKIKDVQHCNKEKSRRDHQSAYLEMGDKLREKFPRFGEREPSGTRKSKTTRQGGLRDDMLWKFQACLQIDTAKIKEYLDDIRELGEEYHRRKEEDLQSSDEAIINKKGQGIRCSKDEAVLELWEVMEKEYRDYVASGTGREEAYDENLDGKRRRLSFGCARCRGRDVI
jgi:hypothetical protein